jgi:hypothetical protein
MEWEWVKKYRKEQNQFGNGFARRFTISFLTSINNDEDFFYGNFQTSPQGIGKNKTAKRISKHQHN